MQYLNLSSIGFFCPRFHNDLVLKLYLFRNGGVTSSGKNTSSAINSYSALKNTDFNFFQNVLQFLFLKFIEVIKNSHLRGYTLPYIMELSIVSKRSLRKSSLY